MPVKDGYAFEWDLEHLDLSASTIKSSSFSVQGNEFYIMLEKNKGDTDYGCFLCSVDPFSSSLFPGQIRYKFDLYLDSKVVKSCIHEDVFYNAYWGMGPFNFIPCAIHNHIIRVKIWIDKTFTDFVDKPIGFRDNSHLFDKEFSNLSFKVGAEVVFVIQGLLVSKSEYLRGKLEGFGKEATVPLNVDSQVPIEGIEVDVFKMIVEWVYTMDIQRLNGISPTLLFDLERVYIAADMYQIADLCNSIEHYLEYLVNHQNFGDIYQLAKRIENVALEKEAYRAWISKTDEFNRNDEQIRSLIYEGDKRCVADGDISDDDGCWISDDTVVVEVEVYRELIKKAALFDVSQKIVKASDWDGDKESDEGVIKCLATLLIIEEGVEEEFCSL
jgi:hypothetical protein